MKRKKKQNKRLLNDLKTVEEYKTKRIENDILNQVYKEINNLLELKQIADDAYARYKNGGNYDSAM